jgi:hypothetical protein
MGMEIGLKAGFQRKKGTGFFSMNKILFRHKFFFVHRSNSWILGSSNNDGSFSQTSSFSWSQSIPICSIRESHIESGAMPKSWSLSGFGTILNNARTGRSFVVSLPKRLALLVASDLERLGN